jgi:iron complex outermembrane recepter protein
MSTYNLQCPKIKTLSFAVAAALVLSPQVQAQQGEQSDRLEEISVTGSRIRQTDGMVTPNPVTVVTPNEIRDFNPGAPVSEQLDNLPQFLNTQTAQRGGASLFGDAAGSYLNLRNMGKQRTLVLFDGSRIVPADRASTVNIDNFPMALVRSVDVVTGGASAAYGADALAGVVNFVLDREFEGLKTSVSSGVTEFGDGFNWNFSVAGGTKIGDRIHLIGSVESRQVNQIYRTPQDLSNWQSWGWVINPAWRATDPPGTNPQRITVPYAHSATQSPAGMITAPGSRLNRMVFTEDGRDIRPFIDGDFPNRVGAGSNGMQAGGPEASIAMQAFDGGPLGAEVVQRSAFSAIKYDMSDRTQLFAQVMVGRTESNTHGRRGNPEQGQQYFATVYLENPFLPDIVRQTMIEEGRTSLRIDKIGQLRTGNNINYYDDRSDTNISQMWSASFGFDHEFNNNWNLRASYQRGESKLTTEVENMLRIDRLHMAMDAVRHPQTGQIMCNVQLFNPSPAQLAASMAGRTVPTTMVTQFPNGVRSVDSPIFNDNAIRDCVPLNIFGHGNASQAAADYVVSDKKGIRDLTQDFAEILLTGELHQGWGPGPLAFAAGLTYRDEWFNQFSRPVEMERGPANAPEIGIRGIAAGTSGGNRSLHYFSATSWATGSFDVWEAFGELNVPVWESSGGNQRFDTNLAYRQSHYSVTGRIDSWKVGAEFQVYEDLRLRTTRSRDVREPTFGEQFEFGGGGANIVDPRNLTSYTITALSGGNPRLNPEEADTLTLGFVFNPSFLQGFQMSMDWYDIDVMGRVGSLGAQVIVDDCHNLGRFCDQVFRNPTTGGIERVNNVNLNVAQARTRGIDIEARYLTETNFFDSLNENASIRLFAGKLIENSVTAAAYRDDLGSPLSPEWTATATMGYNVGPYGIRLIQRYFDSTLNNVLWVEGVDVDRNRIGSQSTTNMVFSYMGETSNGANWSVNFNVTNLFNRNPPITPSQNQRGGQQGANNQFDVFGRRYQLTGSYNF